MRINQQIDAAQPLGRRTVRNHWGLHLSEGILLIGLGILAVLMPPGVAIALVGWLLLLGGLAGLITTVLMWQAPGFRWSLLSAISTIAIAVILFALPEFGLAMLPLLLIAFFVLEGVATIMFALEHRRELSGRWGWMLASGIVDLSLASIILIGLPATVTWAIGAIVGVNLMFGGVAMIQMALAERRRIDRATA
jgi:uncharacterized membrane protein HdeD (DUF308 family)